MRKTLIVLRHEFLSLVGKASFWIAMFVAPLIVGAVVLVIALTSGVATAATAASRASETRAVAVVDQSGLLRNQLHIMAARPEFQLVETEDSARTLLDAKKVNSYYVIAPDFINSGRVRYVAAQFSPIDTDDKTDDFESVLRLALLNGDSAQLARFEKPIDLLASTRLAPADPAQSPAGFSPVPVILAMLFMTSLMGSSSALMQSVTTEKENRVMEVLMSSVTPMQLLTGKLLGLGIVGLAQMLLGLIPALSALPLLRGIPRIAPYLGAITPDAIAWSLVYFVLGYFIYAALMAGLGALMPAAKEASSYTFLLLLPLLIPIYLNAAIVTRPDGPLAVALSLIPFCAPVAMPMRMLSGSVPWWQPAMAALLMAVTAVLLVRTVARVFRAQALLSGSKPGLREVARALR